jgi:hypothetical protein
MGGKQSALFFIRIFYFDLEHMVGHILAARDPNLSSPTLHIMGMQLGTVIASQHTNRKAHYLLIVGYDYQPCFKPENMGQ